MPSNIRIFGYIDKGYTGQSIMVECSIRNGFPGFDITGLPGASVKEARERVRCALRSCGFKFPQSRILVNLSPASQSKDSTLLDLPLACAILCSQTRGHNGGTSHPYPGQGGGTINIMIAGELSLDGTVLQSPQSIGAMQAAAACGCGICILPVRIPEAEQDGITVIEAYNLPQVFGICCDIMCGTIEIQNAAAGQESRNRTIFNDVIGLEREKEILTMAASGFHSTLLFGPPGVGKTMLCSRIHLLMPDYTEREQEEVSRILGCADQNDISRNLGLRSRMRILSHDCTQTQFVSGRTPKSPGEGALSHMGTLVLDEINKFTPKLLETVKDAYDKGYTQSTRSGEVITYPSRFLLTANLNPCPCGSMGDHNAICTCTAQKITSHWGHVGRQMIERFDIRLPVSSPDNMLTSALDTAKDDAYYIGKSLQAAERQRGRYKYIENVDYNGQIHYSTSALLLLRDEIALFNRISGNSQMSSRSQIGTIALARSIADYDDRPTVTEEDFAQASELRRYGLGDYYWRSLR